MLSKLTRSVAHDDTSCWVTWSAADGSDVSVGHMTVLCVQAEAARDSKQSPMVQRNSSFATSHEVWKYICELGISKVDLSMDDIETILNTLIYDGKVEMTVIAAKEGTVGSVDGQMKLYRGVNAVIQPTGLVRTPCGLCPVTHLHHCS
uniref:DNA-directed RNA polymerase III subunit RPC6-like n=1 Tax=Epinephelus lanceolatus TaxID=310571 RepID=UPI001446A5EE|nr:DNA-directed RNA polymerase III subunit RPC6-like [Epinephelus lanceolatus]